jgi:hypothetical protein
LRIREDLAATVDLLLLDPMREKVGYGKWSDLIEALLRRWINEQRSGNLRVTISPEDVKKLQTARSILEHSTSPSNVEGNLAVITAAVIEAKRLIKEVIA